MSDNKFTTYIAFSSAIIIWGLSFVGTKIALESISVFTLIFTRLLFGSLLLTFLILLRGFPRLKRKDHVKMFCVAFFEPGLYFLFETFGLQHTTAPKASLIIALIPIVVLIFALLFFGERSSLKTVAGIVLSFLGIAVLLGQELSLWMFKDGKLFGDILMFGAVISATIYIVLTRDLRLRYSTLNITYMQTLYGALFYLPAFIWDMRSITLVDITARSLGALIYLAIFATIVAFLCYNWALPKVSTSRAAVFINGVPVVTTLGAWLILGEKLTMFQAMGGLLVLFGVYLANLPVKKEGEHKNLMPRTVEN